ncbi:UNVERIFIED_CONTAM: hypothetical protein RMT77_011378 [Armadillidium vulgare]
MEYVEVKYFVLLTCVIFCYGEFNFIDLSHELGPETHFFPILVNKTIKIEHPFKSIVQEAGYSRGFWLAYSEITFQTHMSTYIKAPATYIENGLSIDQIPFRNLFATAAVIDVRDKVRRNNTYLVSVEDVQNWVKENGMFPKHCIVLFNTGWDEGRYQDPLAYYGSNDISKINYPGVLRETVSYILDYEKSHGIYFVGFGVDTATIHPMFHMFTDLIYEKNKYTVNSLKDLKRLPSKGARIMLMPVKIKGAPGAPTRVAAQLPYY